MSAPEAENRIGRDATDLPTPALVADADALEANLAQMAGFFADRPCKLRPHFKSHKCVTLARRQLGAGSAVGITCAKLAEAEALVAGDVDDVLIANQVVGPDKAARLADLNRAALVRSAVDDAGNVDELSRAARAAGVTIGVLVEVDIGMGRCGVAPGEPAIELARQVAASDGLRFDGLQGYEGHVITLPDPAERAARVAESFAGLIRTRRTLEAAGVDVAIVSGGGTGTYDITCEIDGVDEIQAGSYALMDHHYTKVRPEFRVARAVLATIVSARPGRAVADVGVKGLGCEFGPPVVDGHDDAEVAYCAEEHTVIDGLDAKVGEKVRLIPSHGCTTSNLHRRMWICRKNIIEACWPIEAAGALE
ncbi:MAG: DSD1 family PLP-dependent enzyme [Planctomycetota bacterium]|jgi:D-serine deaminase-like pyridoxal phosphate-dependent protein